MTHFYHIMCLHAACALALALGACTTKPGAAPKSSTPVAAHKVQGLAEPVAPGRAVATFAGGCFWCMEPPFEKLEGVDAVISGYTGGPEVHPTYAQVSSGRTGHTEAVRVIYDPQKVTYKMLVDTFWRSMNPTDAGGQFADRGAQYRPVIFFHTPAQELIAKEAKKALESSKRFDRPIVVPIKEAQKFWVAEAYHQDFYKTNSAHYKRYRKASGREDFLIKTWGSSSKQ